MWTSLEITRLVAQAATPIAVAVLGFYLTRLAKRFELTQWRNQRLIDKRIAVYEDLAPDLNDLLCYFTYVGSWKELTPRDIVALKRRIDKKVYLAAPLFAAGFLKRNAAFLHLCYATNQGWGVDAKLKTGFAHRKNAAGANWKPEWEACFTALTDDAAEQRAIRDAYWAIMATFSDEIGIANASGHK